MQVIDSGVGLPAGESSARLFERFRRGDTRVNLHTTGTGIGLNLSRNIVEMHGGRIKAENRSDGMRGACMTVTMLTGNRHLKAEQIVENENRSEVLAANSSGRPQNNIRVLLVDDDTDIPDYIRFELGNFYRFSVCRNGKEALQQLLAGEKRYDIVVSDVKMPEMDGIELLRQIKGNPQTSDLPVILLTSQTEVAYRLEGLKKGADAYLSKPFDMEELHVQIDNLVGNVRRLRGVFTGAATQRDKVENVEIKSNDDQLMERVMKALNANLSDPDYNVEHLAREVGLSRAQLHRKMKEITGLSAGKFVRNLRMEQAARLIREGGANISQVAYGVGFNDQAHFATVFKTYYGMTPSEYAAQKSEEGVKR
jgi:YesN/AraC family two-component response regulator